MNHRPLWLVLLCLFSVAGCSAFGQSSGPSTAVPTPAAVGEPFVGSCTVTGPLRLYNWFEYMAPAIMEQFGQRYGIEVMQEIYGSNEEMIATLKANPGQYDLIFPGGFAVPLLMEEELLEELDQSNIPNARHLSTTLRPLYDTENRYSMPYQWGITGIAYNAEHFPTPPDSWGYFFDPDLATAHRGNITMLDDKRETLAVALIYLGYSVNDTTPAHLEEARALLLAQQPFLADYISNGLTQKLISGQVHLAHNWNGYTAFASTHNTDVHFLVPKEGAVMFLDKVAIPKGAPNRCTAELFINYILEPEVAAQLSNYTLYNPPVPAAHSFLDPLAQEMLELSQESYVQGLLQVIEHPADPRPFDEIWTEVQEAFGK